MAKKQRDPAIIELYQNTKGVWWARWVNTNRDSWYRESPAGCHGTYEEVAKQVRECNPGAAVYQAEERFE